jgi:hypothetical protein
MSFPTVPNPREQDHAIMDIFFSQDLSSESIQSLNRCRGAVKAIFLSDLSTADGRYLENFVFDPGAATAGLKYIFPQEKPTSCPKPSRYVPYIRTFVPYICTFGAPN